MKITKKQFDGFILMKEDAEFFIEDAAEFFDGYNIMLIVNKAHKILSFENIPKEKLDPSDIDLKIYKMIFLIGMDHAFGLIKESQEEWAKKQKITI